MTVNDEENIYRPNRWKRFPRPWRELGPHMAAVVAAVARGETPPPTPYRRQHQTLSKPGSYKREPSVPGFSGAALRRRREAAGYSQSGFAYLIGTRQGRVSGWELGTSQPSAGRLDEIAKVLDCLVSDLLD